MSAHRMSNADAAWLHMDRPTNLMVVNGAAVVRRAAGRRSRPRRRTRAPRRAFSALPPALGRAPARDRRPELGGRPRLRPRPARAPSCAAAPGRPLGARGARRRPDGRAARPQQAAVGHVRDRRLRRRHARCSPACTTASPTASPCRACCCRSPTTQPDAGARARRSPSTMAAAAGGASTAGVATRRPRRALHESIELAGPPARPRARACSTAASPTRARWRSCCSPAPTSRRPCAGKLGVARRVAWTDPIPLADVKAIGHATGTTVNDVLLAAVTGALRRYLARARRRRRRDPRDGALQSPRRSTSRCRATSATASGSSTCRCRSASPTRASACAEVHRRMAEIKRSPEGAISYGILGLIGMHSGRRSSSASSRMFTPKVTAVMTNVPGTAGAGLLRRLARRRGARLGARQWRDRHGREHLQLRRRRDDRPPGRRRARALTPRRSSPRSGDELAALRRRRKPARRGHESMRLRERPEGWTIR